MNSYDERDLGRALKQLALQVKVPEAALRARRGRASGVFAFAATITVLVAAVAVGGFLSQWHLRPPAATGDLQSPVATAVQSPLPSALPSSTARIPFPDATLLAGTSSGLVYKIEDGHTVGAAASVCGASSVLAIQAQPVGELAVVVCSGNPDGRAVLLDVSTMTVRSQSQLVVPRPDVAAWSPDGRSLALLQFGACDSRAPVCTVHVVSWDIASNNTRLIRPDEPLTFNLRWTPVGLSVSLPQGPDAGTWVWDGNIWSKYSSHFLWIADDAQALLVDAPTGSLGGKVWIRSGSQEVMLAGSGTNFPLALDGNIAVVAQDQPPATVLDIYRGQRLEQTTTMSGQCLTGTTWGRWIICTSSGSAALAYSLDTRSAARLPLVGLPRFEVITPLPPH